MPLLLHLWSVAQESPWRPPRPQSHLIRNLGLDELRQQDERLLPAEIARLGGNDSGHPLLHDRQLGPARHLLQGDRGHHFSWQIRIVELVRVANAFVRCQLAIGSTKGVALARAEVRERYLVRAADLGVHVVNLAGESVRRQPFGHRARIQERSINPLGRRTEYTMKLDCACGHGYFSLLMIRCVLAERRRGIKSRSGPSRNSSPPQSRAPKPA